MAEAVMLKDRGVITVQGTESKSFLQGLITSDIEALTSEKALYTAFLTPQGKYLFDFVIIEHGDILYLDCEKSRALDLCKRLMMFRLRAKVAINDASDDYRIWAIWGDGDLSYPSCQDPRHWKIGRRAVVPKGINLCLPEDGSPALDPLKYEDYEIERITLGIPDGSRDMTVEKYFWLECRAEAMSGVSFTKGCYIGQEQTTRMKHRTTIKKSLLPVKVAGAVKSGDDVLTNDQKQAGVIHSHAGSVAMAYIRLRYQDQALLVNGQPCHIL